MGRVLLSALTAAVLAACRTYDNYSTVANQDGLIPPDRFARYGSEQAQAVAIGRALGAWYQGETPEGKARQLEMAMAYAKKLPGVATMVADSLGYRLTVTFKSGWRAGIVPITDGVAPDSTPGLKTH